MQREKVQSWVEKLSQDEAEQCLVNLQGLARQLEGAMDAIVKRQLPSLQGCLHLQSASCASLAGIRNRANQRVEQDRDGNTAIVDSDLAVEITSATEALLMLNRRYAALLKHSGKTLQLLAGLYRSYPGSLQPGSVVSGHLQTWSCEG